MRRYSESTTNFHHALLDMYKRAVTRGHGDTIAHLDEPVSMHWRVASDVLAGLPADLGGGAAVASNGTAALANS